MRSFRQFDEESQAVEAWERNRHTVGMGRACQRVSVTESSSRRTEGKLVRMRTGR